jgi:hypothetical protein
MKKEWSVVSGQWSVMGLIILTLTTNHYPLATALATAAERPSLFRGVIVADSPVGVRVVSVEDTSQASLADLRPEDIIIRIDNQEIHSIDEFAVLSKTLKGRSVKTEVLVFRNGVPRQLLIHLYSYPILSAWGLEFVPDHDLRFAEPRIGLEYWARLGRGFEEARNLTEAVNAYLNGLHNVPTETATALKVADLFSQVGQQRLSEQRLPEALASLRQATIVMQKLFESPLTDEQLQTIRDQLQATLDSLRSASLKRSMSP